MPIRECLLLVGHNGFRYGEVAQLRALARELFGLPLVLVNDCTRPADAGHFAHAYRLDFDAANAPAAVAALRRQIDQRYRPLGVLPFYDKAVPWAALLAAAFGLPGAEPVRARAGIDKGYFRSLEGAAAAPADHHRVRAVALHSYGELVHSLEASGGCLFVKPNSEGNSRGCIALQNCSPAEARAAWDELRAYRSGGILAEELIAGACEYSWDYAAGVTWLTQKGTSDGKYRAELQQIVPALSEAEPLLERVGQFARSIVCSRNGAYHNELFHLPASGKVAIVEVNLRPAGMHIWNLARIAFHDFDPWKLWLEWAVSGRTCSASLRRRAYSGIRFLRAPQDGRLRYLPDLAEAAKQAGAEIVSGAYSKQLGSPVTTQVRDNAGTYGYVVCEAGEHRQLAEKLRLASAAIERATVVA